MWLGGNRFAGFLAAGSASLDASGAAAAARSVSAVLAVRFVKLVRCAGECSGELVEADGGVEVGGLVEADGGVEVGGLVEAVWSVEADRAVEVDGLFEEDGLAGSEEVVVDLDGLVVRSGDVACGRSGEDPTDGSWEREEVWKAAAADRDELESFLLPGIGACLLSPASERLARPPSCAATRAWSRS